MKKRFGKDVKHVINKSGVLCTSFTDFLKTELAKVNLSLEFLEMDFNETFNYLVSKGVNVRDKLDACRYKLNVVSKVIQDYLSRCRSVKDVVIESIITNSTDGQLIAKLRLNDVGIEQVLLIHDCPNCQICLNDVTELEKFVNDVVDERVRVLKEFRF